MFRAKFLNFTTSMSLYFPNSLGNTHDLLEKPLFDWGLSWWTVPHITCCHTHSLQVSRLFKKHRPIPTACSKRLGFRRWSPTYVLGRTWNSQAIGVSIYHAPRLFELSRANLRKPIHFWKLIVGKSHILPIRSHNLPIKSHILPIQIPYSAKTWKSKTRNHPVKIP